MEMNHCIIQKKFTLVSLVCFFSREPIISLLFPTRYLYEEKIYHHPRARDYRSWKCCLSQLKGIPNSQSCRVSRGS
jgi:hypothetical protein